MFIIISSYQNKLIATQMQSKMYTFFVTDAYSLLLKVLLLQAGVTPAVFPIPIKSANKIIFHLFQREMAFWNIFLPKWIYSPNIFSLTPQRRKCRPYGTNQKIWSQIMHSNKRHIQNGAINTVSKETRPSPVSLNSSEMISCKSPITLSFLQNILINRVQLG